MSEINWEQLKAPFPADSIEWRIGQAGKGNSGIWAKVLAYVSNRAIQARLDEVLTPANWQNEYRAGPQGGVVCGISVRVGDEWVTKWDGAENTDIESVKGGLSDSMKRAAVQWGIGRYLYELEEGWAVVKEQKFEGSRYANCKVKHQGKDEYVSFHWAPPALPGWAIPAQRPSDQDAFNAWVKPHVGKSFTKDQVREFLKSLNNDYKAARTEMEKILASEGAAK